MAYVIPTFNLECNVWHAAAYPPAPPAIAGQPCALMHSKKNPLDLSVAYGITATPFYAYPMFLLLPALTDVRDQSVGGVDVIECPAGSGRFYFVNNVDDVAKGYVNEYRVAVLLKWTTEDGGPVDWPIPIP